MDFYSEPRPIVGRCSVPVSCLFVLTCCVEDRMLMASMAALLASAFASCKQRAHVNIVKPNNVEHQVRGNNLVQTNGTHASQELYSLSPRTSRRSAACVVLAAY